MLSVCKYTRECVTPQRLLAARHLYASAKPSKREITDSNVAWQRVGVEHECTDRGIYQRIPVMQFFYGDRSARTILRDNTYSKSRLLGSKSRLEPELYAIPQAIPMGRARLFRLSIQQWASFIRAQHADAGWLDDRLLQLSAR